jgi:AraC family transcriptional regulator of adaptative response / DNA-3-methyladenine glycosylase II
MLPAHHICERARLSRDPRFDGAFFIGVVTTGIYCRPVCPVRQPAAENVRYYPSAAAAEEAGFRPCRRCLPERAARVPEWCIGSRTVIRGLRLIDAGVLDSEDSTGLAARLGVTARHLNRLFHEELGATPKAVAMNRRRALAKRLIDETRLPFSQVALQAGYRSLRRFNDDVRRCYGRHPSAIRAVSRNRPREAGDRAFSLRLPVREPYNAPWVFEFLKRRALAGFEEVGEACYRRRVFDTEGNDHWISVTWEAGGLRLQVPAACTVALSDILLRVRRVFDLDADSRTIDGDLAEDSLLAEVVTGHGGLRVPGAWDGFETTVRAILGQQVSVDRATALAHKLLDRYGPTCLQDPAALARATPAEIGLPGRRGLAISRLATEVAAGALDLHEGADAGKLAVVLCAIPGIGPWTAGYVAMRVAKDPDAYPVNDWVVLKMLERAPATAAVAKAAAAGRAGSHADGWRPWRAYAVMYLWKSSQSLRSARLAAREA